MVDDSISEASRLLRATRAPDADLQTAESLIKDAETHLANMGQTDDSLALIIARRVQSMNGQQMASLLDTVNGKNVCSRLPGLLGQRPLFDSKYEQAAGVTPDLYQELDVKSRKLELVAHYLRGVGEHAA